MSDAQIDALIALVAQGQGVEAALKGMGLNVNIALDELQKHPSAKGRIQNTKKQVFAAKALAQLAVQ